MFITRSCRCGGGRRGEVGRVAKIGSKVDVALRSKRVLIIPTYEQGTWADRVVVLVRNVTVRDFLLKQGQEFEYLFPGWLVNRAVSDDFTKEGAE